MTGRSPVIYVVTAIVSLIKKNSDRGDMGDHGWLVSPLLRPFPAGVAAFPLSHLDER